MRSEPISMATDPHADRQTGRPERAGQASWLLCRTGAQLCAIQIEHVIETMRVLPIEVVHGAPHYVRGLCIIRGAPVVVVDIGLLLGERETPLRRLVTIRTGHRTVALAVEAVPGIWSAGAAELTPLHPLLHDAASDAVAAIGRLDAELLLFLRAARIVPQDLLDRPEFQGEPT